MNAQTFIFIHDQDLLFNCERAGRFNCLKPVTYVFLGGRDISLIKNRKDVLVCRTMSGNLEQYPKLTSFSGWYALWKNGVIESEYSHLFEYDVQPAADFHARLDDEMGAGFSILGYVPFRSGHPLFIQDAAHIGPLLKLIRECHGVDAAAIIDGLDNNTPCSRTSNHTFRRDIFEQYMSWMEPMVDGLKATPMAGHHIERSISLFYLLNEISRVRICPGLLEHTQANSHKTYPRDKVASGKVSAWARFQVLKNAALRRVGLSADHDGRGK